MAVTKTITPVIARDLSQMYGDLGEENGFNSVATNRAFIKQLDEGKLCASRQDLESAGILDGDKIILEKLKEITEGRSIR